MGCMRDGGVRQCALARLWVGASAVGGGVEVEQGGVAAAAGSMGSGEEGQVVLVIGRRGGRKRRPDLASGVGGRIEGEQGGGVSSAEEGGFGRQRPSPAVASWTWLAAVDNLFFFFSVRSRI